MLSANRLCTWNVLFLDYASSDKVIEHSFLNSIYEWTYVKKKKKKSLFQSDIYKYLV